MEDQRGPGRSEIAAKSVTSVSISIPGESSRRVVSWVFTANLNDDFMYSLE
jgi:hypothetical protein